MADKILVGIDGSEPSVVALDWAVLRALSRDATLHLVHVVDNAALGVADPDLWKVVVDAAERLLADQAHRVSDANPGLRVDVEVAVGNPIAELQRLSQDAILVVIGTHKGGAFEKLRGTRSEKIVAATDTPVAVIPQVDLTGRTGVVVGVDGSAASERAIAIAAAEADKAGLELIAIHAWNYPMIYSYEYLPSPDLLDMLKDQAEETLSISLAGLASQYPDLVVTGIVAKGDAVPALNEAAAKARVVVVGNRGRNGLTRLLLGSVSHGVLTNIVAPTVVVKS